MSEPVIGVEVAYALPERQTVVGLTLPAGSTVMDAVRASGILEKHPEIDFAKNRLGIYGKQVKTDAVLRDRDRVEIYRPLIADPKEVRRRRAAEGRLRGDAAGG